MEAERGQGESLSSDSTQSRIAQNIISDDVQVQADNETRENVQPEAWDDYFLDHYDILNKNGVVFAPT